MREFYSRYKAKMRASFCPPVSVFIGQTWYLQALYLLRFPVFYMKRSLCWHLLYIGKPAKVPFPLILF